MRIAMWSGPRNLSTAMMYSFGARDDCAIWDEPFYAAYLQATGIDHPLRQQIIDAGEPDPDKVIRRCLTRPPKGKALFYQKHMTQHLLPGFDRQWMAGLTHVFLIRAPERVIASYHAKREHPCLDDIGFWQQAQIFDQVANLTGQVPVVIDSSDIRNHPEPMLRSLCQKLGIAFQPAMLDWPLGGHKDDGVWASHWYRSVWNSSGFSPETSGVPVLPNAERKLADRARPFYQILRKHCLTVTSDFLPE